MDFDLSKENIQPLRRGRNVQQLEMALQAQTNPEYQMQLQQQREHFEHLIKTHEGDDPLENYYEYITWIEQSYPKNGHEGNCTGLLEFCLAKFENDPRYTNDIRFCRLWIKYIDMFPNPVELYLMMKSKNLCTGCADFYKAWAYYYEAAGDFQRANNVFEEGKKNLAQPYEELEAAHKNLVLATGEHFLYGPNENKLQERRQALTSLHAYRSGRVNNVRVPSGPSNGISTFPSNHRTDHNAQMHIYEDQAAASLAGGAAPSSIITVAKRQEAPKENTLKAGPWTTVPHKKRVLANHRPTGPGFTVHEDDTEDVPVGCLPSNLPPECLEDYSNWHVNLINYPDDPSPTVVFGYPKHRVYAEQNIEYSIEEIRARRYQKKKDVLMEQIDSCQGVQPIYVDEEDDCIVVVQDPPAMETAPPQTSFQIYQGSPVAQPPPVLSDSVHHQPFCTEPTSTVIHSPWKSQAEHQSFLHDVFSKSNEPRLSGVVPSVKFSILEDPEPQRPSPFVLAFTPSPEPTQPRTGGFVVYEQSMQDILPQATPKGNAMKTAFRTLNADEVETGSRGGMDVATAAQPADGAKPMAPVPFSDSSSSSYDDNDIFTPLENTCTTQQFNFNLNAMQVSTPQNKNQTIHMTNEQNLQNTRKTLFSEHKVQDKALSTIEEERSCSVFSSSSSGATTKSSLSSQQNKMVTISEEHSSYLEQNMKANEALRRSLLSNFMEDIPSPQVAPPIQPLGSPMQSTPVQSPVRKIPPPAVVQPLDYVPSDPFNAILVSKLLDRVSFPGIHSEGFIQIEGNPNLKVKKEPVNIGRDRFRIEKQLGKGQFGTVFKACNLQTSCTVALKYQKPPNRWEFYICRELQARLVNHPLRDRFMDISVGYFSDQASILISQYEPFGSLLDTANILKKLYSKGKEAICVYFTLEMLKIVRTMHEVKIIHADIKPDNFLVMLLPGNTLGLQLIDFGCSIDMTMFPDRATFTRPISTEDFICCEVKDGRPWSYHTDLFCVAASAHVLLFQEYIQLRKSRDEIWSIASRLPRYTNQELWTRFFSSMLNQQSGPADAATLQLLFEEELEKPERIKDLPLQLNSLINALKSR